MSGEPRPEPLLSADEQLVPFDLLQRWLDDEQGAAIRGAVRDDAELWAVNALSNALERRVAEPFQVDYRRLVEAARARLRDRNGGDWPWR